MRKVEKLGLEYLGYSTPETQDEVELTVLGLELLIKTAEQRILMIKQGSKVAEMAEKVAEKQTELPEDNA